MNSLLEQVNSLIKMQVGDPYRLEHIKSRLEQNKVLTLSDTKYLNVLLDRYNRNVEQKESQTLKSEPNELSELKSEPNVCWKCEQTNPILAKFCNSCGSSLVKLPEKTKIISEKAKKISEKSSKETQSWIQTRSTTMPKRMGKGKKILIGIGILVILIVIVGLIQGDQFFTSLENIFNDLQQKIDSLLAGFSADSPNSYN
ncbi:MAG: hypothetical protein ACE5DL_02115 [Nitrosopumilaceae archaeon]